MASSNEVDRLIQDARLHLSQGGFDAAVERAGEAIRLDARATAAYLIRAEAHRRLKRNERALADLAVAIRLAPDRAQPFVIRAEILKKQHRFDQAIADATQAILIKPDLASAYAIRGECRRLIGDREGAQQDAEELFRLDPTRPLESAPPQPGVTPPPAFLTEEDTLNSRTPKRYGDERDLFADGKPVDKTYRSREVVSDEEAPEVLGVASGYKPGVIGRPIPRQRTTRKGPQVSPILAGVVLLGLLGGGYVLVNQKRSPQDVKQKETSGQPAGTTTAVRSEPDQQASARTIPIQGDVVPAAPAVALATNKPNPEPATAPPQVAGLSVHLLEVAQLGGSDKKVWWLDLDETGTRAVTAEDRHLKLWDFQSGFQNLKPIVLCSNDASVNGIMTAAFLPGSENVVTGHWNGEVRVWDTRQRPPSVGKVIKKFPDLVPWVAVSPNGKLVATGVRKLGQVDLWRNEKGDLTHLAVIDAKKECWGARFSPDSRTLAVGYTGETILWDCPGARPRMLRTIGHEPDLAKDPAFSPDGGTLAIPIGSTIKLYDLKREAEPPVVLEDSSSKPPSMVLFSKSGKALFSCGYDQSSGSLAVWDISQRQPTQTIEKVDGLDQCLSLSRDGTVLVSGGRGGVSRVLRVLGDVPIAGSAPSNAPRAGGVSTQPSTPASSPSHSASIAPSIESTRRLEGHTGVVLGLAFSPQGKWLVSASGDATVRFWDVAAEGSDNAHITLGTGSSQPPKAFISVMFSPDGKRLAASNMDGRVFLWDCAAIPPRLIKAIKKHDDPVVAVAFTPDGNTLATGGRNNGLVCIWDLTDATIPLKTSISPQQNGVWSLAYSPDGKTLIEGVSFPAAGNSAPGQIWVWDVDKRPYMRRSVIQGVRKIPRCIAYSPDGSVITCVDGDVVRVIDAHSEKEVSVFQKHTEAVGGIAFMPDGKYLLSGGYDKTARLWDARTGEQVLEYGDATDAIEPVAVSPDGRFFAVAGHEKLIRLIRLRSQAGH